MAIRISSKPICFKQFYSEEPRCLRIGFHHKPLLNPRSNHLTTGARNYCRFQGVGERSSTAGAVNTLPWLAPNKAKAGKGLEKVVSAKAARSSWEESAELLDMSGSSNQKQFVNRIEKEKVIMNTHSSWKEAEISVRKDGTRDSVRGDDRNKIAGGAFVGRDESVEEEVRQEEEAVDDPRWDKIKNTFRGIVEAETGSERPEVRRWNKQENWGRKTWKEATESTVPKIIGEGVYGIGPVLAALAAGRREFYALYVQEGLDLGSNNRKKKDKKGFEKVLRIAEKNGISVKEASKHDLNMVVNNRPHQGLVLDASPLELVKIKELEPLLAEEDRGALWVALDEVTDPQNLGAIIRSSYFFGASGVVLCAKNSAPLSGVVSKASAGSLELMELRYCKNMMQFLASSAENGWRVLGGSVSSKAAPLNEISPGAPTILVLGSEGTGLRPLVERSCTQLVRIPGNIPIDVTIGEVDDKEPDEESAGFSGEEFRSFMAVESLNVSVAAGVLLHHLIGNNQDYNSRGHAKPTDMME